MAFMKQAPRNRLAETETILCAEFEHPANSFLPRSLGEPCVIREAQYIELNDGLEIILQGHPSFLRLREKASFDFGPECEGNGHCILRHYQFSVHSHYPN